MTVSSTTVLDHAAAAGRLTIVIAPGGRVPELHGPVREVRVDASTARGTRSTLALSERMVRALDPWEGAPAATWDRMRQGLRRTLLGEERGVHVGGTLLASLERLALTDARPLVWVVERAHLADAESRGWLARQVRHMARWPVAVVLGVQPEDPWGLGLAAQARHIWDPSAVVDLAAAPSSHPGQEEPPAPQASPLSDASARPVMSPACETTLMAAAVVGSPFELAQVAGLVGLPDAVVAAHLQQAHLAGFPLESRGAALFLDAGDESDLRTRVLAPVRAAWEAVLATEAAEVEDVPLPSSSTPPAPPTDTLLDAAEAARVHGAWGEASRLLEQAAQALEARGETSGVVAARIRLARARLAWSAAGQGVDLPVALAAAQAAEAELKEVGGVGDVAEAHQLVAAIAHDIGDAQHLELALERLTLAIRALQEAGRARDAARLLNDQAAVWVRLGDPVRAVHLLEESRRVFAAGTEPADAAELAETLLLLARLPLHVAARPGLATEASLQGVQHAAASAQIWRDLADRRGEGLALETEGRLLLQQGRSPEALDRLQAALTALRSVRDALGLARVADALAHALVELEHWEEGVRHLAESVRFNAAVGSALGLEYNEASAHRLRARIPTDHPASAALDDLLRAHAEARAVAAHPPRH